MSLIHLPNTATASEVVQCLREHGYAIIDKLVPGITMDRIAEELEPYTAVTSFGSDGILGRLTKRTGGLIARSTGARELILNPTILDTTRRFLSHATTFQIHCTQVVSIHPGAKAQTLHQDEVAWDMYPFPNDYHVQCNTLWAMTDYSEKMGATRIVPGSHRAGRSVEFKHTASYPAEMEKGSVLVYDGKVYHGGGANRSNRVRSAINLTYALGWLRQEENQFLSCPLEIARTLPDELLRLMGYQCGAFALGYVHGFEDPMTVLGRSPPGKLVGAEWMLKAEQNDDRRSFLREERFD
ncbi:Ectoine hydroxylase-related dioxygenase, phytanoyl-CoA dioxygenase (PhyH) family [Pseudomonas sp. ok272]|uniref:phytanoyl-CoA dioxygenase family protein n=1 Tax=unclassified Pseudomonas TaxID=196821 RepID=UPI0008BF40AA|nr:MULTISPECIES: phytanoyl-CoA dioxygenase family protein [unclassified Pseudomonas]SEN01740.1 Ectoine hydroxylase-related dioxygenase, phytanoyl-CoA dioxygenase (PhyH) family [Pseudomonas sp. ok272]SFM87316.1 Ectoine hydroxylase-related dioxygenase, phytanoyl-CoA dioxygenase (PhyH) family [Pseudomonas sp. ok602]